MSVREQLQACVSTIRPVVLEHHKVNAYVRELTAKERNDFDSTATDKIAGDALSDYRERLLLYAICDEDGRRAYNDEELSEVYKLPALVRDKLYQEAMKVNYLAATDIEGLKKTSGTDLKESSPTG